MKSAKSKAPKKKAPKRKPANRVSLKDLAAGIELILEELGKLNMGVSRARAEMASLAHHVKAQNLDGTTFAHSMKDAINQVDKLSAQCGFLKARYGVNGREEKLAAVLSALRELDAQENPVKTGEDDERATR